MPVRNTNRVKGNKVTFLVEGVEYNIDVNSVVLTHVESDDDFVSFGEGSANYEYRLSIRAAQDTNPDSFHTFIRESAGVIESADFTFGPHGNAIPTTSQPHVSGTIEITGQKPDVGGEKGGTATFEMEFKVIGDVTWITAVTP